MLVRGQTLVMPFEGGLVIRVFDAQGRLAAETPIIAQGDYGGPATFEATITYGGVPGVGRVEVVDYSPRDGSVVAQASQTVTLAGFPGGGYVELPAPMSRVTLPIKLLARVGTPGQQVSVIVRWADGTQFGHNFTTLGGLDGRGLLIVPLDRVGAGTDHPQTQAAAVEISTPDGSPLAWQPLTILHPLDPDAMATKVYWTRGEDIVPQTIHVPRTVGIARASLEALLWGPVPDNADGFTSALPSPEYVLAYPGRDASWGERITIRDLKIIDGVAYADFSIELTAHSGGALQVTQIREQIEATLRQFSTVNDVVITVNGQPAMLEP